MNYYWSSIRVRGKEFQWNDSYTNGECACIISKCAETQCVSSLYFRSRCDRGFYFSCPLLLVSGDACLWVVVVDVLSFFAIKSKKKKPTNVQNVLKHEKFELIGPCENTF